MAIQHFHSIRILSILGALSLWSSGGAQLCYEAPTPRAAYRAGWHPEPVPLPSSVAGVRGMAWDASGAHLWIHTDRSLLEFAAVRGAGGRVVSLARTTRVAIPSPVPGAARSLAMVGSHVYVVGNPGRAATLYELDLRVPPRWSAHTLSQDLGGARLHAVMSDRSPVVGSGNPDGLLLVDRPGRLWRLVAQRTGGGPLSGVRAVSIPQHSVPVGFGQWQPIFVPRGEPGFSPSTRSVLAAVEPSSGQNSRFLVFDCTAPGPQASLGDWVPVRASAAPVFVDGGNCRGAARDPRTGDLLLLMHALWDGFSMRRSSALFAFRRGKVANGCTLTSQGGSGQPPFPVVSTPGSTMLLGGRLVYAVTNAPPVAQGALLISAWPTVIPVRVGPQALTVLRGPGATIGLRSSAGGAVVLPPFSIPNQAQFIGVRLFAQAPFYRASSGRFTLSGVARTVIR